MSMSFSLRLKGERFIGTKYLLYLHFFNDALCSYGFAYDPSTTEQGEGDKLVGSEASAADVEYKTVFEDLRKRPLDKRKKEKNNDPSDIDGYLGPWAKYADEETVSRPKDDDAAYLEEYLAKRQKKSQRGEEEVLLEEKSVLHVKDTEDYQGRGYTHVPQDLGVNLKADHVPHKCFIPKRQIHTWAGHKKGVSVIRWFPSSAHLIMSGSMDATVKLYEVYGKRRLIRTFTGHKQAIRDVNFNNSGSRFLSASYDRYFVMQFAQTKNQQNVQVHQDVGHRDWAGVWQVLKQEDGLLCQVQPQRRPAAPHRCWHLFEQDCVLGHQVSCR